MVTAFVCQNPEACTKESLHEAINCPQGNSHRQRGNGFWRYIVVEEVEDGGNRSGITSNVSKTSKTGAFETVSWNGVSDLVDGVIGDFEFVSVRIEKNTSVLFSVFS